MRVKSIAIILLGLCFSATQFYYPGVPLSKEIHSIYHISEVLNLDGLADRFGSLKNIDGEKVDTYGNTHIKYQQFYNGVPVFGRSVRAHFNSNGFLSSMSSNLFPDIEIDIRPSLNLSSIDEILSQNKKTATTTTPELIVLIKENSPILCYKIDTITFEESWRYYVNANSGVIEEMLSLVHTDGPTTGSGTNLLGEHVDDIKIYEGSGFGGMDGDLITPNLVCEAYCWDYGDCDNQNYNSCEIDPQQGMCPEDYLEDCNGDCFHSWYMQFPGVGNGFCNDPWIDYSESDIGYGHFNMVDESNIDLGRIFTINSFGGFYEDLSYVNSATDTFDSQVESLSHASGISAHDYQRKTQDYMWNHHGYAGIDGMGKRVISVVNYSGASGISQNNAFFNAALDVLTYGLGSGSYRPFCAAQDIVSHEYAHGFTAHTSGLIYKNQPGALNESISDALGFFLEAEYQEDWDWLQGEDVHMNGSGSRSFIHPPTYGHPDHVDHPYFIPYNSNPVWANDFGGVHTNLGIPNKILYLVIQGDTHYGINVDAFDDDFDVSRMVASNIWFNWNAYYLGPEDDFGIAREKMLQACYDLYPTNSNYYETVANAWASTGVGDEFHMGDANQDTILNIQDIIIILQFILGNYELNYLQQFAIDVNQDQAIDILDIIQVVNSILYGV